MIEYVAHWEQGAVPHLCKRITAGDEVICTIITPQNLEERENFSDEAVYEHLDNQVSYLKELSLGLEFWADDEILRKPFPLKNMEETLQTLESLNTWWNWQYFRHENDHLHAEMPAELAEAIAQTVADYEAAQAAATTDGTTP